MRFLSLPMRCTLPYSAWLSTDRKRTGRFRRWSAARARWPGSSASRTPLSRPWPVTSPMPIFTRPFVLQDVVVVAADLERGLHVAGDLQAVDLLQLLARRAAASAAGAG